MNKIKVKPESKIERLAADITRLRDASKLESWSSFIRQAEIPSDIYPALMTMRSQLMPAGRAMDASECQVIYNLIGVLLDTNSALREHTEQTAKLVNDWVAAFKGMHTLANHVQMFANFQPDAVEETTEEDG